MDSSIYFNDISMLRNNHEKSLLAAALALTATCAHAGDTAVLKVKASLTSNSCTPELSNDGVIDFGTVQVGDLANSDHAAR